MKKILLTSFAVLSVIGVQAAQTYSYTFNQGDVEYGAELVGGPIILSQSVDTTKTITVSENLTATAGTLLYQKNIKGRTTEEYIYDATAISIGDVAAANLYSFKQTIGNHSTLQKGEIGDYKETYEVGTPGYAAAFAEIQSDLASKNVKSYNDMSLDTEISGYYYWIYDEDEETYKTSKVTDVTDSNLNRNGYYWKRQLNNGNKVYYLIRIIYIAEEENITITRVDSCHVNSIDGVAAYNSNIQSISIGKDIKNIADSSFYEAPNLSNFSVQSGNTSFILASNILYNNTQTEIVAAGSNVQSQVIPSSVRTIRKCAFYNTANEITITSMNSDLEANEEYQGSKVTFVTPSESLTIVSESNNGYTVTGNVTQDNFNAITQTGTYFDFRGATIMEDLAINNQTNTIYYFATTAEVTGNNVVNNGTCENFVLKDSYRTSKFYCPIEFNVTNASYDRVFDNCWSTMCIPFNVDGSVVSNNLYCGEFRTYKDQLALFTFIFANSITANVPYIVRTVNEDQELSITAHNTKVYKTEEVIVSKGNASFINNYEPTTIESDENYNYFGIKKSTGGSGNPTSNMVRLTGATVNSFRSYLKAPFEETNYFNAVKIRLVDAMDNEIEEIELPYNTSGIEKVDNVEKKENAIYDLNGQMQKEVKRGLNIVNGKVVINK